MIIQTHWQEDLGFEPWNPAQQPKEHYTGLPGGYSTFYYRQIPNTTQLVGATEEPKTFGIWSLISASLIAIVVGAGVGFIAGRGR